MVTAAAPEAGVPMAEQGGRRWIQIDTWLRHREGAALTRREQALARLPTTYERRMAVAKRERAGR